MGHSGVACATCVAIAVARGHVSCVRALITEGRLQSEWLWLPALHVTRTVLIIWPDDEYEVYKSRDVLRVLREWPCMRCSASTASSCISEHENSQRESESVQNCDHIRSFMNREEERKCVLQPRQSAFFAFSLYRLALSSLLTEIRTVFIKQSLINSQNPVLDHSGHQSPLQMV